MELLFKSTRDLLPFLPMLDANITFDRLVMDLEIATYDMRRMIGREIYDYAIDGNDLQLKKFISHSIALDGYRNYVKQTDVSHTNEGRVVRLNDQEKIPFEWMIERDNQNLERKYYQSLDRLFEHLYEHNPENWKSKKEYKECTNRLFRTTSDFDKYFVIESRYLLMKLAPAINKCIEEEIKPRLNAVLYEELLVKMNADVIRDNTVLFDKIKQACAYYSLHWSITRMSATLFPEGALQIYVNNTNSLTGKQAPKKSEIGVISNLFLQDFNSAIADIEVLAKPKIEARPFSIEDMVNINNDDRIINL
ncbi:hypothetical protein QP519_10620 [Weeksella virosa]|uniref:DUF6712 family protein n=1 Tax=Weeksella virosa TaxID=1014 RepID=UPI0025542FBF|nr:DUF6712 family protein [Weeksella virosa]MDK7375987.1 hypothetical protein [Weeksella virosa]